VDSGQETTAAIPLFEASGSPGTPIGKHLTLFEFEGKRAVFHRSVAIHIFDANDKAGEAACIAMLSRADLASDIDIAKAFECHRNTVGRLAGRLQSEGMAAVVPAKRGPKGPRKVTSEVLAVIEQEGKGLGSTALARLVAERTGVVLSDTHIRRLRSPDVVQLELLAPDETSEPEQAPVLTPEERTAFDPPVTLPRQVRGRYMGAALYYPALAALGLLEVSRGLFRLERSERFGVRAVISTLFFMTLLRMSTLESAKHLRRREFGALVGTGRAPAVKTLRRKLADLVEQQKASELGTSLAKRWVTSGVVASAYLYVDGHMKAYTGKRHLQEVWNSQRRMPLPAVHSYYVSDQQGRPLLFLTEELSANLAKAMPRVVEAIREVIGERSFTVVFDRGGYDSKLFSWLVANHIDFITYQRRDVHLEDSAFHRKEARFEGRRIRFTLAEDEIMINRSGPWRRIIVRTKDGHQTPILTSHGLGVGSARIACLMFARWRQENFFKYMGEHHGLDQLVSYEVTEADQTKLVANPLRKRLDREIAELRRGAAKIKAELGDVLLEEPRSGSRSAHGLKTSRRGAVRRLRVLEEKIDTLVETRRNLPARVPVSETGKPREALRLEHKAIVDRVKITAYNAEEWLLERLTGHYPNPHDVRDLLRAFAELSGEIKTTERGVEVTLDPPDTPAHRRALQGLIEDLNAEGVTFPGTDVPVSYRVAMHYSEAVA
jgi:HEPN domain-containing protein